MTITRCRRSSSSLCPLTRLILMCLPPGRACLPRDHGDPASVLGEGIRTRAQVGSTWATSRPVSQQHCDHIGTRNDGDHRRNQPSRPHGLRHQTRGSVPVRPMQSASRGTAYSGRDYPLHHRGLRNRPKCSGTSAMRCWIVVIAAARFVQQPCQRLQRCLILPHPKRHDIILGAAPSVALVDHPRARSRARRALRAARTGALNVGASW
jgi:hypothetical protein